LDSNNSITLPRAPVCDRVGIGVHVGITNGVRLGGEDEGEIVGVWDTRREAGVVVSL